MQQSAETDGGRPRRLGGLRLRTVGIVAVLAVPLVLLFGQLVQATPFAATASVTPQVTYLNDSAGTVFTFVIKNTGTTTSIGAVEIRRPLNFWSIVDCPAAPTGWSIQRADPKCRYTSADPTSDDIQPGHTGTFHARIATSAGTQNQTDSWAVTVSSSNKFDNPSLLAAAAEGSTGLDVTAHTFQVLDAVIADAAAAPGSACPPANRSATTGSTHVVIVCGKNRSTGALTPNAANSSLSGTMIATSGTFSSGSIAANSGSSVVLGN